MKQRILYIEDEVFLARIVTETLERRGYDVQHRRDGTRITEHIKAFEPAILVLDVMLPHIDGFSLGSAVRNLHPRLPIIYVTAKTQTNDVLDGFSAGGTDYLKKPFSVEELVVRIENQLRLNGGSAKNDNPLPDELQLGNYQFAPARYELRLGDDTIRLSHREAQVLSVLCRHTNTVLDRSKLLMEVWGDDSFFNSRTLDVYIRKLRDYLARDQRLRILTLKGRGYQFVVPLTR
jgi:DNA-binding response OmpR family regulator